MLITIILLSSCCNLFAQTATTYASATIVNSVGAETSGAINFSYNIKKVVNKSTSTIIDYSYKVCTPASSLSIIGSSIADDVSIQSEPILLRNKNGLNTITVNVSKGLTEGISYNTDKVNIPVNASLASNFTAGNYTSSFKITVNFN